MRRAPASRRTPSRRASGTSAPPSRTTCDAQEALGFVYQSGAGRADASPNEAAKWYLLAAEQNRPAAQNQLGVMYAQGVIPDEDTREQIAFYTTGSGQLSTDVAENLERLGGRGAREQRPPRGRVVPPRGRAELRAGDLEPRHDAAAGRGAEADPDEALRLYERAAALGRPDRA